jgi:hypothetical protein
VDHQARVRVFERLRSAEDSIMVGKGAEYTMGSEDVNANFKLVASLLDGAPLDDLTVAAVYMLKHLCSVCDYVVRRPSTPPSGEGIEGRISDLRNYAGIIMSIIEEHQTEADVGLGPEDYNDLRQWGQGA